MNNISIAIKISHFSSSIAMISQQLGLEVSHSHYEGEIYSLRTPGGVTEKAYAYNYWEYRKEFVTTQWVQELVNDFIDDIVRVKRDVLKTIAQEAQIEFFVGMYHYSLPSRP
ncbi:hypothetical protein FEF09_22315 [Chitinophaga pinensis]|uniref:Uncharacterized protein n=1 Tax=Chitinophaga pinensis TaxID=79329 RepID=A0A5C6LRQ7_9BACT|nr:hypothetical protein FEF09_22315 [Chitinophaga pinensis]